MDPANFRTNFEGSMMLPFFLFKKDTSSCLFGLTHTGKKFRFANSSNAALTPPAGYPDYD